METTEGFLSVAISWSAKLRKCMIGSKAGKTRSGLKIVESKIAHLNLISLSLSSSLAS